MELLIEYRAYVLPFQVFLWMVIIRLWQGLEEIDYSINMHADAGISSAGSALPDQKD